MKASELSFVLYKIPDDQKYSSFCISKKGGGTRQILAPCSRLKWIQGRLLAVLYECEDDLAKVHSKRPNLHYGFRRDSNIFENATLHRKKKFVFNVDIASYFDQFNFGRVRGFFLNDLDFALAPDVATTIAQIACFNNVLPQGSPTSPHIANLATRFFDIRMTRFLRARRCVYSRYADDITISTSLRAFPTDVAIVAPNIPQGWAIAPELQSIFTRAGLPVNPTKTRMSSYMSRQTVTGLVVNLRPNVTRQYYLMTRAMCHRLFTTGLVTIPDITESFGDNCASSVDGSTERPERDPVKIIEGRLSHIHHIREKSDSRSIHRKQDEPTQFWRLIQNFFIYKYFVGNRRPIILTEGPSDIFYLKTAILNSSKNLLPELKRTADGRTELIPTFFKFDTVAAKVLGLTGGTGNIKRFLYLYNKQRNEFNHTLREKPVIILIDNDSGGSDVLSMVNGMYKTNIKIDNPNLVYKVTDGLILTKTPHVGAKMNTTIEDLLPANVRGLMINGKTFSPEKKIDTSKNFGKIPLANYVQDHAKAIDFGGFAILLQGLNEAIGSFQK